MGTSNAGLQSSKVDMMSTKNLDMKQRRAVNAAASVDTNDYIIQDELNTLKTNIQKILDNMANGFITGWTQITKIVTSMIRPVRDSTTAIQVFQADGQTPVITIDTVDSMVGFDVSPPACKVDVYGSIVTRGIDSTIPQGVPFGRFSYDVVNNVCDIMSYHSTAGYQPLTLRGNQVTLGVAGGYVGFYGLFPVHRQILNGYTPFPEPINFSGISTGFTGAVYAQVNDLNNLRTAVENLRLMCEDLRTKLQTSTLVG